MAAFNRFPISPRFWVAAASATIAMAPIFSAHSASGGINVDFDVTKTVVQVGEWFKAGFSEWQDSQKEAARNAVPNLVVNYLGAAALLDEVSNTLDRIREDKKKSKFLDALLVSQLNELNGRMSAIRRFANQIDPKWVAQNFEVANMRQSINARRSILVSEATQKYGSLESVRLAKPEELEDDAAKLRAAAHKARELAKALAATVGG